MDEIATQALVRWDIETEATEVFLLLRGELRCEAADRVSATIERRRAAGRDPLGTRIGKLLVGA